MEAGKSFKFVVDILNAKQIVLNNLVEIDLSILKTRKKLQIFSGLTEKKYYITIFLLKQKSRFLVKNAKEIVDLEKRLEKFRDHTYKNKLLFFSSPMCSKAKLFLSSEGWKIIEVKDDTL